MRIFVAGGSGVMGRHLVPLLVAAGHQVTAMTRSTAKVSELESWGASASVCDAFDTEQLAATLRSARPEVVINQLTDLPDDAEAFAQHAVGHARIRRDGTKNLATVVADLQQLGPCLLVSQSIAWDSGASQMEAVASLEATTLGVGGTVLRYGRWYGPGTFSPGGIAPDPSVHISTAATLTVEALTLPPGCYLAIDAGISPVTKSPNP